MEELVEGLVEVVSEGVGEMFDTGSSGSSNSKDGRDWRSALVAIFAIFAITVIGAVAYGLMNENLWNDAMEHEASSALKSETSYDTYIRDTPAIITYTETDTSRMASVSIPDKGKFYQKVDYNKSKIAGARVADKTKNFFGGMFGK
jgi:hypothetical protein